MVTLPDKVCAFSRRSFVCIEPMKKESARSAAKSKPEAQKQGPEMAKLQSLSEAFNIQVATEFSELLDTFPAAIIREALDIATPTLTAKVQTKKLFDNLDAVIHVQESQNCKDPLAGQRALGFHDGKLVDCDGKKCRPISLADSVDLYRKLVADAEFSGWSDKAVSRWCKMIASALRRA